jgi:hypothetical protein
VGTNHDKLKEAPNGPEGSVSIARSAPVRGRTYDCCGSIGRTSCECLCVARSGRYNKGLPYIGSYRLDDGRAVDIAPSDGDTLRWRTFSGETGQLHPEKGGTWASTYGWTDRPDGKNVSFSSCAEGGITFEKEPGRRPDHF